MNIKNIKNKIGYFIENERELILILFLCALIVFHKYLFFGESFEIGTDNALQFHQFYEEWIRLVKSFLKTREWPFYSWYSFLGNDFFASKYYYAVADIFLPLLVIARDIKKMLLYITVVLVVLSGVNMDLYLARMDIDNKNVRHLSSVIYALSGIATIYYGNYLFHRFYAFLPLLFLGTEGYIRDHKKILFIFAVALLFTQNYYFMFPTSFFLVGYYIASYYSKKKDSIVKVLCSALPLIGYYLIGVAITLVFLWPTVLFLLKNERVGAGESGLFFSLPSMISVLLNLITPPTTLYSNVPYMFYFGRDAHDVWFSLYTTSLTIISLLSVKEAKKEEKPFFLCYGVFCVILLIKPLNSIVHGFSGASFRWVFLLCYLQVLLIAMSLSRKERADKRDYILYSIVVFICCCLFAYLMNRCGIVISENVIHFVFMVFGMLSGYVFLYLLGKDPRFLKWFAVVCVALPATYTMTLYSRWPDSIDSINKEFVSYFLDVPDNQLQRIYINSADLSPFTELNYNQSLHYRYMGTETYDTTFEPNLTEFLHYIGHERAENFLQIKDIELLKLLGVRYYAITDYEELPEYADGFTYAFDLNNFHVYELNDYNHIAHTYYLFIPEDDFLKNYSKDTFEWENVLILNTTFDYSDIEYKEKEQMEVISHTNNSMDGVISVRGKCVLFTAIPYSEGWKVHDYNGNQFDTIKVDGGFLGVILPEEGEYHLHYQYTTPGFKVGAIGSMAGAAAFLWIICREVKNMRKREN